MNQDMVLIIALVMVGILLGLCVSGIFQTNSIIKKVLTNQSLQLVAIRDMFQPVPLDRVTGLGIDPNGKWITFKYNYKSMQVE